MARDRAGLPLWPTLAAIAGIVLTGALGSWQLERGAEKTALQRALEARRNLPVVALTGSESDALALEGRTAKVRGRFEPKYAVYLDNRVHAGAAGYHVVIPLRIGASDMHVLVNRGWIAAGASRTAPPAVITPSDEVELRGRIARPTLRFLELSSHVAEGNVWQNLVIERYREAMPINVLPFVLLQESPAVDGLLRDWPQPDAGADQNYAYALQWFTMAGAIAVIFLVLNVRRRRTA